MKTESWKENGGKRKIRRPYVSQNRHKCHADEYLHNSHGMKCVKKQHYHVYT